MASLIQRAVNSIFEITAILVIGVALITFSRYYLVRSFPVFVDEAEIESALNATFGWIAEHL